jgi:hypothetical protein
LSNHKFNNYKSQAHQSGKDREKSDKHSKDEKEDKDEQEVPMSFAQLEARKMLLLWQARPQIT